MGRSYPSSDVRRDYVDPTMPKLVADLHPSLTIKVPICQVTLAAVDRRPVLGDLLIAFTCVRRSEFMEAFELVCMQDIPGRANDLL